MIERPVLVTAVGGAGGSLAAAAALACAGSEPDRAALLIDAGGRTPRPTLLASAGARALEERLAAHLPHRRAASRGCICQLAAALDADCLDSIRAALPLAREAVAVVHLPPALLQPALDRHGLEPAAVLVRADLPATRALSALLVRDLLDRGVAVSVLKRPLAWIAARRALFGVLDAEAAGGLPASARRLLPAVAADGMRR